MVKVNAYNKFSSSFPLSIILPDTVYQFLDNGKLYRALQYMGPSNYAIHLPTDVDASSWWEEFPVNCGICVENRKMMDSNENEITCACTYRDDFEGQTSQQTPVICSHFRHAYGNEEPIGTR